MKKYGFVYATLGVLGFTFLWGGDPLTYGFPRAAFPDEQFLEVVRESLQMLYNEGDDGRFEDDLLLKIRAFKAAVETHVDGMGQVRRTVLLGLAQFEGLYDFVNSVLAGFDGERELDYRLFMDQLNEAVRTALIPRD